MTPLSAVFSADRIYRYELEREVNILGEGTVTFCMLNASTADEHDNDPTVTRDIGFARQWGFRWLRVVNIFGLAAADPKELYESDDPVGVENDYYIAKAANEARQFIAAWGVHGALRDRGPKVLAFLRAIEPYQVFELFHLGLTKDGHPKHPLYLPKTSERQRFAPTRSELCGKG